LTPHSGELSTPLPDSIKKGLQDARSITRFYSHQAAAINAIAEGKHVIVSTATASGKSVIYQVPVLRYLEEDKDSTAIYIYPTKVRSGVSIEGIDPNFVRHWHKINARL
jgi:DEAD/DEAH box helicase domain-containing protein